MYRGGDYDSAKIKSNLTRATVSSGSSSSGLIPSPFTSSDVQFWFEKGISKVDSNPVNLDVSSRTALVTSRISNRTSIEFTGFNTSSLSLTPNGETYLVFNADRAFSIWCYQLTDTDSYGSWCGKDTIVGTNREWNFTYITDNGENNGKTVFTVINSAGSFILTIKGDTTLNAWTHWVLNYDHATTTFSLYKNNSLVDSAVLAGSYNVTSAPVCFGGIGTTTPTIAPQTGFCSQFIGFSRKLTTGEISSLYNSGSGLYAL